MDLWLTFWSFVAVAVIAICYISYDHYLAKVERMMHFALHQNHLC